MAYEKQKLAQVKRAVENVALRLDEFGAGIIAAGESLNRIQAAVEKMEEKHYPPCPACGGRSYQPEYGIPHDEYYCAQSRGICGRVHAKEESNHPFVEDVFARTKFTPDDRSAMVQASSNGPNWYFCAFESLSEMQYNARFAA